jgi:hypothetical protein
LLFAFGSSFAEVENVNLDDDKAFSGRHLWSTGTSMTTPLSEPISIPQTPTPEKCNIKVGFSTNMSHIPYLLDRNSYLTRIICVAIPNRYQLLA